MRVLFAESPSQAHRRQEHLFLAPVLRVALVCDLHQRWRRLPQPQPHDPEDGLIITIVCAGKVH